MAVTERELKRIQGAIGREDYADYVYAQGALGIHPGVLVALKKTDVRMEGGQMILDIGDGRGLPVSPQVREIVELRLEQPGTELLFPRADIRYIFRPLMEKLGIAGG